MVGDIRLILGGIERKGYCFIDFMQPQDVSLCVSDEVFDLDKLDLKKVKLLQPPHLIVAKMILSVKRNVSTVLSANITHANTLHTEMAAKNHQGQSFPGPRLAGRVLHH